MSRLVAVADASSQAYEKALEAHNTSPVSGTSLPLIFRNIGLAARGIGQNDKAVLAYEACKRFARLGRVMIEFLILLFCCRYDPANEYQCDQYLADLKKSLGQP